MPQSSCHSRSEAAQSVQGIQPAAFKRATLTTRLPLQYRPVDSLPYIDDEPSLIDREGESGGRHGIRTHDLLVANEALSQLS